MPKINSKKTLINLFAFLFSICYLLFAVFPASAELDIPFLNLFQQSGSTSQAPAAKLTASDLSLVWSTNTYTPPDYSGKPLPSYDSVIKILAQPTSQTKTDLSALVYKWYLDDQFQQYNSGENLMRFWFKVSDFGVQQHYIDLKIEDKEGHSLLNLSTIINIVSPQVIIYPSENQAANFIAPVDEQAVLPPGQEKTYIALPYFFSASQPDSLDYQWTFDGQTINKVEEKNKFSVKVADGAITESFTKNLSVLATNPVEEIQRAAGQIEITIKK